MVPPKRKTATKTSGRPPVINMEVGMAPPKRKTATKSNSNNKNNNNTYNYLEQQQRPKLRHQTAKLPISRAWPNKQCLVERGQTHVSFLVVL